MIVELDLIGKYNTNTHKNIFNELSYTMSIIMTKILFINENGEMHPSLSMLFIVLF